jgi:energy-converting hydrogenase Eha subunit E
MMLETEIWLVASAIAIIVVALASLQWPAS